MECIHCGEDIDESCDEYVKVKKGYMHGPCFDEYREEEGILPDELFGATVQTRTVKEFLDIYLQARDSEQEDFNDLYNLGYTFSFLDDVVANLDVIDLGLKVKTLQSIINQLNNCSVVSYRAMQFDILIISKFNPEVISNYMFDSSNQDFKIAERYVFEVLNDEIWSKISLTYTGILGEEFRVESYNF